MRAPPERLFRCSTSEAIRSLAERFGLPNEPDMQDWEWEVADPNRIDEFLAAYESGELNDAERFTLMEMIILSFADLPTDPDEDARWQTVLKILEAKSDLHIFTIWYWSALEDARSVTPSLRKLLYRLPQYQAEQNDDSPRVDFDIDPEAKAVLFQGIKASVVAVALSLFGFGMSYTSLGPGLFLFVPFCTGLAIAFMSKGKKVMAVTVTTSLLLSLAILILTGLEGILCVVVAAPILFVSIGMGAGVGYFLGKTFVRDYGNTWVIALCLVAMTLVGWTNREMARPEALQIQTSMNFDAPMSVVWDSVIASGPIEGDETALRLLGLPVPQSCAMNDDGTRVCYFENGEMIQRVTESDHGRLFAVEITESFEVREWLIFIDAQYEFVQRPGYVQVIRTDTIESHLRPRWYWEWFETQCVRLEHRHVMRSMKTQAEQAALNSESE